MGKKQRVSTEGGQSLSNNPFGDLGLGNLPSGPAKPASPAPAKAKETPSKNRGRLDVKRVKAGRGGKTVTLVSGWKGISNDEKVQLCKQVQKRCGVGGAVKEGNLEVQGDKREEVRAVLEEAGFQVVFAGG